MMKKKTSRILALVLGAALISAIPAFAAGVEPEVSEKTGSGTTKLVIWGHQEEVWNDNYQKIADDFMAENPDIEISFEFFPYDDFEAKV